MKKRNIVFVFADQWRAHCGEDKTGLLDLAKWRRMMDAQAWQAELARPECEGPDRHTLADQPWPTVRQ